MFQNTQWLRNYPVVCNLLRRNHSFQVLSIILSRLSLCFQRTINKIGFGYGLKSNAKDSKLSPGPGDYNLSSFTDRFMTSLYKQARKKQQRNAYTSIQPSPRDCSLAKPLSGGVFDPNGVLTKEKTLGFNYPPLKFSNLTNAGNMLMAKVRIFLIFY